MRGGAKQRIYGICMLGSQAFDLGLGSEGGWGGQCGGGGESLRFLEMKLMIRRRAEIRFQISCSIAKSKIRISKSKSGFSNLMQP